MHLHGLQGLPLTGTQANAAGSGATPSPRLVRAAHEFEGQLMEQLLKPMTDSDGLTGDSISGSAGALGSFAAQTLGQALSAEGGLGLADQIIRSLTPAAQAEAKDSGSEGFAEGRSGGKSKVTKFGNQKTEMSGRQ